MIFKMFDRASFRSEMSKVEQYVMAYRANQDKISALLPEGYSSLRPVLRINVELLRSVKWLGGGSFNRIEFNTPVEHEGKKGWLNLITWEDQCDSIICSREVNEIVKAHANITAKKDGMKTGITAKSNGFPFLKLDFTRVGKEGGCPMEADNEGTFYYGSPTFIPVERLAEGVKKEYCDCCFQWQTPSAKEMPVGCQALGEICSIENDMILGAYVVQFDREKNYS